MTLPINPTLDVRPGNVQTHVCHTDAANSLLSAHTLKDSWQLRRTERSLRTSHVSSILSPVHRPWGREEKGKHIKQTPGRYEKQDTDIFAVRSKPGEAGCFIKYTLLGTPA